MSRFKRFASIIFVLATGFVLASIGALHFGFSTPQLNRLMATVEFREAVLICGAISALGLLLILFSALFSPRNADSIEVGNIDGDKILVSRSAIASQASHIVEEDGLCFAKTVKVRAKKHGHVRVFLRIVPEQTVDVLQISKNLHTKLEDGLAILCGDTLEAVHMEFLEPTVYSELTSDSNQIQYTPESQGALTYEKGQE